MNPGSRCAGETTATFGQRREFSTAKCLPQSRDSRRPILEVVAKDDAHEYQLGDDLRGLFRLSAISFGDRHGLRRCNSEYATGSAGIGRTGALIMPPIMSAAIRRITSESVPPPNMMTGARDDHCYWQF